MLDAVVCGGGLAGLVAARELARAGASFALLEAGPRCGGKIRTEVRQGFVLEGGPDSFLTRRPEVVELVRDLGLGERLLPCRADDARLFLLRGGDLLELPPGMVALAPRSPEAVLGSAILDPEGRRRFLAETEVPPRRDDGDESLADFTRRRFGAEALERLVEPILAHLHVGDPERMSLAASYPHLREMERRAGSVLRAVWSRPAAPPGAALFASLAGGVAELVDALVAALPAGVVRTGARVGRVEPDADGDFVLSLGAAERLRARSVVLALPAAATAVLVADAWPEVGRDLAGFRTEPVATVSLGFDRAAVEHPLAGFGFFVPRSEGLRTLACTWTSSKFTGRAPAGAVLLRAFVGGPGEPAAADPETAAAVERELRPLLGLRGSPRVVRVDRTPDYPQADVGHAERVRRLQERLSPGLRLAGSAFHGVGLPDVVASGRRAAREALERPG